MISECLSFLDTKKDHRESHHLMSACYFTAHWVVLSELY